MITLVRELVPLLPNGGSTTGYVGNACAVAIACTSIHMPGGGAGNKCATVLIDVGMV